MHAAKSERGSVLIIVALSTVAMLGIAALSVDASFMFDLRNKLSAAADAAAKSAAFEVKRKNDAYMVTYAQAQVDNHTLAGLIPSGVVMDAHFCDDPGATCTSPYNTHTYVEVILSKNHPTFFGNVLGFASLTPVARAVAGIASPKACFITMQDLYMKNANINLTDCAVEVGRDLTFDNNPSDIGGPALVTGSCSGTRCADSDVVTGAPYPDNPYKDLVAPTVAGACVAPPPTNPLPPGCYTSLPNTVRNLAPGVFKITGPITVDTSLTGTGVLLYMTSTSTFVGNTGILDITGSNSIAGYEGIAIYGDPGSTVDLKNNFTWKITGATVMSGSDIEFKNSVNIIDTGCNIMIFNSFQMKAGNGQISATNCAGLFSGAAYLNVALAE